MRGGTRLGPEEYQHEEKEDSQTRASLSSARRNASLYSRGRDVMHPIYKLRGAHVARKPFSEYCKPVSVQEWLCHRR